MRAYIAFFICLAFLMVGCHAGNVAVLESKGFDEAIAEKAHFVKFYTDWCGYCKQLKEPFEELGEKNAKANTDVVIAKVNAEENQDLATRFGVRGYPTLLFFPKNSKQLGLEPVPYQGNRVVDDMLAFIAEKAGKPIPRNVDASLFGPNELEEAMKRGWVLTMFFAPWCGHCKAMKASYDSLIMAFQRESTVTIAKVDCTEQELLCKKYDIGGYPTLKLFSPEGKTIECNVRDLPSMLSFVNTHCGTARLADGTLNSEAGRSADLDTLALKYILATPADRAHIVESMQKYVSTHPKFEYYLMVAKRILEKGEQFAVQEHARLEKMLTNPNVTSGKKDEFTLRLNVLKVFLNKVAPIGAANAVREPARPENQFEDELEEIFDGADQIKLPGHQDL